MLVILGMIIRLKLEESDEMKAVLARKKVVKLPLAEVLRKHWVLVLLGAGALPLAQVTYFKNTFALSWATKELGYDRGTFLAAIAIALVVQFIVQPFGAVLVSKIDMRKAMCLMVIPEFVLMPAMFFAIRTGNFTIAVVAMCLATIPHSMFYGAIAGVLARAFPPTSVTPVCRRRTSCVPLSSAAELPYWRSGCSTRQAISSGSRSYPGCTPLSR